MQSRKLPEETTSIGDAIVTPAARLGAPVAAAQSALNFCKDVGVSKKNMTSGELTHACNRGGHSANECLLHYSIFSA
jgi:hypothetical protein